jgi:hypothetical protein
MNNSGGLIGHDQGVQQKLADDMGTVSGLFKPDQWYRRLIEEVNNDSLQGYDHYPKTLIAAFSLLMNWK